MGAPGIKYKGWKWSHKDASNPTLVLVVDDTSKAVHIADSSDADTDWAVSADSYPSLYVHTAGTNVATDYLKFYHDDTDGFINAVGATALNLLVAGSSILEMTATTITSGATTAIVHTAGTPTLGMYTTCAGAVGTVAQPQYFYNIVTGAGQLGGRYRIHLETNVTMGSYANALKASVDLKTAGGTTGLLSAICAEMTMATTSISGTYAALELEMTYGATNGTLAKPCFIYANTSGTADSQFDDYGDFLKIGTGPAAEAGHWLSVNSQTLRVGTGALSATKRYLVMSQTEDCLNLEGTITLAIGIGSTTPLTTATTAMSAVRVNSDFTGNGYHIANWFTSRYTTAGGYGTVRAVVGQANLSATQTTNTTAQYMVGVHGRAQVGGTAYNTGLFVTGVHGQILTGGTWTAANHVSAIWADWQLNATLSGISSTELLYLTNNANNGTNNPANVMYIYAPYVTYLLNLNGATNGGMVASSATAGTMTYTVKCYIDGVAAYLHLYNA